MIGIHTQTELEYRCGTYGRQELVVEVFFRFFFEIHKSACSLKQCRFADKRTDEDENTQNRRRLTIITQSFL